MTAIAHVRADSHSSAPLPERSEPAIAGVARNLHSQLALANDARTSTSALVERLEEATQSAEGGSFAEVTEQLTTVVGSLEAHIDDTVGVIGGAVGSITHVAESIDLFDSKFQTLSEFRRVVSKSTRDIVGVAEQIKLLALNARIEAAHAGKAGAGFNVVASEISTLAKETTTIVDRMVEGMESVERAIEEANSEFEQIRSSLGTAQTSVSGLEAVAEGMTSDARELVGAADEVESLACAQVKKTGVIEDAVFFARHVSEASEALVDSLLVSVESADRAWADTVEDTDGSVEGLAEFETRMVAALTNDSPAVAERTLERALDQGIEPSELLNRLSVAASRAFVAQPQGTRPAIEHFRNARILEHALNRLEPLVDERVDAPAVVLGNAPQDYHDLGRRVIGIGLRAAGFRVVDLGLSVPIDAFVEAVKREKAQVVGVSALLLHTAEHIPDLRAALDRKGLGAVKVIVGGAPFIVDPELAERCKADGVARDPRGAIRLVQSFYAGAAGGAS